MQDLKEVTHATHYENFRRQKLAVMMEHEVGKVVRNSMVMIKSNFRMKLLVIAIMKTMTKKSLKAWSLTGREHLEI